MINLTKPLHQKTYMPEGYEPSALDILCGRGVECFNHSGNIAFRKVIEENLDRYTMARTKLEKSILVVQIVDIVRNIGGSEDSAWFLRMDHKVGKYYEIGDDAARQKVGQTLRELLIQRDPEKRAAKAAKRADNKAKRAKSKSPTPPVSSLVASMKQDMQLLDQEVSWSKAFPSASAVLMAGCSGSTIEAATAAAYDLAGPPSVPTRAKSAPVTHAPQVATLPEPTSRPRRAKSDLISLADAALAAIPPTLREMDSSQWFTKQTLQDHDSDLSDIDTLFGEEEHDEDQPGKTERHTEGI